MNIRISIRDCDSQAHSRPHHLSEVDQKKKTMLYAPPEKDTNRDTRKKNPPKSSDNKNTLMDKPAYRESEKQLLEAINKNSISIYLFTQSKLSKKCQPKEMQPYRGRIK